MQYAAVLWVLCAVVIIRAAWRSRRHHDAVRTGRRVLAFLFIAAGAAMNVLFLALGEDYANFADGAPLAVVRDTWRSLVVPHHELWIGLLIAFEVAVGLLALAGGRRTQLAYGLAIAFHMALLSFGWGFSLWSVPMIAAYVTLLRAERRPQQEASVSGTPRRLTTTAARHDRCPTSPGSPSAPAATRYGATPSSTSPSSPQFSIGTAATPTTPSSGSTGPQGRCSVSGDDTLVTGAASQGRSRARSRGWWP